MSPWITIKGARQHNLKNIDLQIPRNTLVVITGLSGSGKSSLALDTIYAEGQRRYVESLSAYARQFLELMEKPDVDSIEGLSPAVAIEQKRVSKNPRSTVGTVTEIYDYMRLLFARLGTPYCPQCGKPITSMSLQEMVETVLSWPREMKIQILAPFVRGRKGEYRDLLSSLKREGFVRVRIDGEVRRLEEPISLDKNKKHTIELVVDRLVVRAKDRNRLADSMELALNRSQGLVVVWREDGQEVLFSETLSCPTCGVSLPELSPRIFSFNSPYGACPRCDGLGFHKEIDPDRVVEPSLSLAEGAIVPWRDSDYHTQLLMELARQRNIPTDVPFCKLEPQDQEAILYGTSQRMAFRYRWRGRERGFVAPFEGVIPHLERRYRETDSERVKGEIEQYMKEKPCPQCQGTRLKAESLSVKIQGLNIAQIAAMSVKKALEFFSHLSFTGEKEAIAHRIIREIRSRLEFLEEVGLGYLTLDRASATLSGGESQRIRLATQIGSGLVGVTYVLDEPSVGLHPRDQHRLLENLKRLRDLGNTVIVVEHDEATIRTADYVVDLGPGAGRKGGEVVIAGPPYEVERCANSITGQYLRGEKRIPIPTQRRRAQRWLEIRGASHHNLKEIDVSLPLGCLICVTGVSGSGKSTLIVETLYPALRNRIYRTRMACGPFKELLGAEAVDKVVMVDQSPIGRTPRSNPATYTGLFTPIRELFASLPESRARGYTPGRFSFNVRGGRCEHCRGEGAILVEMHFLPDLYVTCQVCQGKRYNQETLDIRYKGRNIHEVLEMTVEEALEFFQAIPSIHRKLELLNQVGLGYIKLGQPATTLSGGEAQRVKLSRELSRRPQGHTLYILDEPTTGLHLEDVRRLLEILHRLVDLGNTVIIIEHHPDIIKNADWIIDLGPEGGEEGGYLVAQGPPEEVVQVPQSITGRFLSEVLEKERVTLS
ncbi:MAG TPA: excinuclease ABC subunit UvrA [Thermosulfidibacter takaii]|uniref:UvrABC system protein A n=1 Tax=Thermosulfidibacter takaii TaxID=412593 RepID=A0A7C0Y7Z5_9BACT|nr:excinuclease ABC subunit UvrA [Thermosulfidibacter takaii]